MTTNQAYRSIRRRLEGVRNRILAAEGALAALRILAGVFAFFALNIAIGAFVSSFAVLRAAGFLTLLLLAGFAGRELFLYWRRRPRLEWIAGEIERLSPALEGDLLRAALDLGSRKQEERFGYSPALIDALVADALAKSEAIRERGALGAGKLRRAALLLPLLAAAAAVLVLGAPDRAADVIRLVGPGAEARRLESLGLEVFPGDCRAGAGEAIPVEARFAGYRGTDVFLLVQNNEDEMKTYPMAEAPRREGRAFEAEIPPLEENARYRVRFEGGESSWYTVSVRRPPVLTEIAYTLRFPSYTGLREETVRENHGNVSALYGTLVRLEIAANKPLREGRLEREGEPPIELRAEGASLAGSFTVDGPFEYRVRALDEEGAENADPVLYRVVPLEDEKPFVRIDRPAEDIVLGEGMKIDLGFSALDDFGVTKVLLVYRKGEEDERRIDLFETSQRVREIERERAWDLSDLNLFPEDVVVYYLEAWDNDTVRGPKRGVSEIRRVRMPSLAEVFAEATGDRASEIEELEEIYEESRDLEKTIDDLAREIRKSEEVSWEEKKKIEGILERQKDIEQSLREVSEGMEKAVETLEENRLITPETLARMAELAELLNEVATDEMRRAMQELQQAMQELNPEEIRKAAENLNLTQQDLIERLDRAIEMLKRLRDLQDADAIAASLQRLAERQRELRERSEASESSELADRAAEEEALREELERMAQEMEEAARRAGETSPDLSRALQESRSSLEKKQTSSKMSRAAESLRAGQKNEGTESQQEAENDLFDLAFRLSEQVASMCSASRQRAQAAFGESILDLLYLSERQEEIVLSAEGMRRGASIESRRSLAEKELEIAAALGRTMEKIREVGREVPELSAFVLDMLRRGRLKAEEAARRLEEGQADLARARSSEAMSTVNRAVVELLRSMENQSASCSSPSGQNQGLQEMQQMTEEQRGLNRETAQLPLPSSNPASLPMEARAEMTRLAAEQNRIRKGLEELQGEVEEGGEVLGKLDQILEEMRKVERDLEKANLSPETRERQEKILSRMLDAQRSLRDRGYRRERRSRTGGEMETVSPESIPRTLSEVRERMREDPLRTRDLAVPPEYEELIRSYFRSLTEEK